MLKEFKEFVMRGNVLDLAVAVIIGTALGAIVTSMVNDIVMPPIGLLLGNADFKDLFISLSGQSYPTLAAAKAAAAPVIAYGQFLNPVINFLIVAFVIFIAVRQAGKMQRKPAAAPAAPATRNCQFCCTPIPVAATRCAMKNLSLHRIWLSAEKKRTVSALLTNTRENDDRVRHAARILSSFIVPVGLLLSTAWADQLVMKNGDRVTGTIIKQDGKTITVKTDNFGVVTAPWDQVASVKSDEPVNVVLKDGKTLVGTLAPSDGKVEITTKETKVDVSPGEVSTLRDADEQKAYERLLNPNLLQLWSGTGSIGLAGANGNAKTLTFTAAANAARVTNTDKTSLYFSMIKASALVNGQSASTAQAVRGGIGYNHNVSPRLFVNVFNDYEYDRFQDLDLRFVIGGGFGFHAVKNERSALDLLAGVAYDRSSFSTPLTRNSAQAFWGDDYTLKLTGASSLTQSFRMFNNLSDTGAYRVNFNLNLVTTVRKWLSWNLGLTDWYLSNPVPGRKTNDWIYTTGLGIAFGR